MIPFHKKDIKELKKDYNERCPIGTNKIQDAFAGKKLVNVMLSKESEDWVEGESGQAPENRILLEFECGGIVVISNSSEANYLNESFFSD